MTQNKSNVKNHAWLTPKVANTLTLFTLVMSLLAFGLSEAQADSFDLLKDDHKESGHDHQHEEAQLKKQRMEASRNAPIYACHLYQFANQCRQYAIPADVESKISDLKLGCESMPGGRFIAGSCKQENRLASCKGITRNSHDPKTLIYDNHFYQSEGSAAWDLESVVRTCRDLEGTLLKG